MYILIIGRGYPTDKYKMNGIFEFDQAKALVELGYKIIYAVVDLRSLRRFRKWGIEHKQIEGVNIYAINIPCGRISKSLRRKIGKIGLKILYKKILKEQGRPEILHAHFTETGYISLNLKQETGIPLVVTEHSSAINKNKIDNELFNIANEVYNNSDAVISVSNALTKVIKSKFLVDPIYIPNIVDTDTFEYSYRLYDDKFNFVSVGNLIHTKRMDVTIKAFFAAFGNNKKVTLTIFGEGPKRKELEILIKKYNLETRVNLMGMCSRKKISEFFKKSDCFVLASQSETFGVAYIEAMSVGVPVIATKCGGPEDFVNNKNGLKVEINNINELAEAMKYMYLNISKYNRKYISIEINKQFSAEIVGEKIIKMYKTTLINDL